MDRALLKLSPDLQEAWRWPPRSDWVMRYLVDQVKLPEGSDGASIVPSDLLAIP